MASEFAISALTLNSRIPRLEAAKYRMPSAAVHKRSRIIPIG
jgi:hypothetical protein